MHIYAETVTDTLVSKGDFADCPGINCRVVTGAFNRGTQAVSYTTLPRLLPTRISGSLPALVSGSK